MRILFVVIYELVQKILFYLYIFFLILFSFSLFKLWPLIALMKWICISICRIITKSWEQQKAKLIIFLKVSRICPLPGQRNCCALIIATKGKYKSYIWFLLYIIIIIFLDTKKYAHCSITKEKSKMVFNQKVNLAWLMGLKKIRLIQI